MKPFFFRFSILAAAAAIWCLSYTPLAAQVEVETRGPIHEAFAQPVTTGSVEPLVIPKQPPAAIEEIPPEAKPADTDAVWISGYWAWDDDRQDFLWISGVWRVPPPNQQWVAGYWTEVANGYQWVPGFWTPTDLNAVEYFSEPPSSLERGPTSDPPSANYIWVPGSWRWHDTRFVWQPGFWSPAREDWVWQPASYCWSPRGWIFTNGYWDYPLASRGLIFAPVRFTGDYHHGHFEYTPSVAINVGLLSVYLFNRPNYHHYYFGDYFARSYDRVGIYPWYAVNVHRDYVYDPLFSYYRWHNGQRDPKWVDNLQHWHAYYRDHADLRPPRTLSAQRQLLERAGDRPDRQFLAIADTLDNLRQKPNVELRLTTVPREERDRFRTTARDFNEFRSERQRIETQVPIVARADDRRGVDASPTTPKKPQRVELPKLPVLGASRGTFDAGREPGVDSRRKAVPEIPVRPETSRNRPVPGPKPGESIENRPLPDRDKLLPVSPPDRGDIRGKPGVVPQPVPKRETPQPKPKVEGREFNPPKQPAAARAPSPPAKAPAIPSERIDRTARRPQPLDSTPRRPEGVSREAPKREAPPPEKPRIQKENQPPAPPERNPPAPEKGQDRKKSK